MLSPARAASTIDNYINIYKTIFDVGYFNIWATYKYNNKYGNII